MFVIIIISQFVCNSCPSIPFWLRDLEFVPACSSVYCGEVSKLECGLAVDEYVRQFGGYQVEKYDEL